MITEPREALPRTSTFTLIAGQPASIDLTTVHQGDDPTLHTLGIYSIDGDLLTYCIAAPDVPRPTQFATAQGDGCTLVVLKRLR